MNNTDIEKLAQEYTFEAEGQVGFTAGFNAALEELQKEYTEVKDAYIENNLISDNPKLHGRFDILVKRKDLL